MIVEYPMKCDGLWWVNITGDDIGFFFKSKKEAMACYKRLVARIHKKGEAA